MKSFYPTLRVGSIFRSGLSVSELIIVFLQPCLLKMESFFSLQNVPEERLAQSMLYQWMPITYQDLVTLTSESLGMDFLSILFSICFAFMLTP